MFRGSSRGGALLATALVSVLVVACTPAAQPSPTAPPAQAAPTTAPAKQEAKPAATTAPAKAAPTPAAKAAASPAAKAAFDEQAVADFYSGKTVRIVLGLAPGSGADLTARLVARHIQKYIPGQPNIIVENRPGAGGVLAANSVFNVEPQDGTVIGAIVEGLPMQQALDAPGIEFDSTKFQWIGSLIKTPGACMARLDSGVDTVHDLINGKELIVGTSGPGSTPHDIPSIVMATTGAKFRLVPGYPGGAQSLQAVESKEVDGYCVSLSAMLTTSVRLLEGDNPVAKIILVTGDKTPEHPLLKGVPATEPLAKTEEGKMLQRVVGAPGQMTRPFAFGPGVPADRVAALRTAFDQTMVDKEFLAEAEKAQVELSPSTGEEVTQTVQTMLGTPKETLAKLKDILK